MWCEYPFVGSNCTETWEGDYGRVQAMVRATGTAVNLACACPMMFFLAKTLYTARTLGPKGFKTLKLHLIAFASLIVSHLLLATFFGLGFNTMYSLNDPRGKICSISSGLSVVFTFIAVSCLLVVLRRAFLGQLSKNHELKRHELAEFAQFVAIQTVGMLILAIVILSDLLEDPIEGYRFGLVYSAVPILALFLLARRNARKIQVVLTKQADKFEGPVRENVLAVRATFISGLQTIKSISIAASLANVIIGSTQLVHIPQVYFTTVAKDWILFGPLFHFMILRMLRPGKRQTSNARVIPTTTTTCTTMSASSGSE